MSLCFRFRTIYGYHTMMSFRYIKFNIMLNNSL